MSLIELMHYQYLGINYHNRLKYINRMIPQQRVKEVNFEITANFSEQVEIEELIKNDKIVNNVKPKRHFFVFFEAF